MLQIPGSIKLCCLDSAFQVAVGWTDSHLHQFEKDGKNWGVPEWDEFDEFDLIEGPIKRRTPANSKLPRQSPEKARPPQPTAQ